MSRWFRHYAGMMRDDLSPSASRLANAAFDYCIKKRTCYPPWGTLFYLLEMSLEDGSVAVKELEEKGIAARSFPTTLLVLEEKWPLPPMFGQDRLPQNKWATIRAEIFARDDFTCTYCGERGGKLECDHIVPAVRGGSHDETNLTTACFACNRSKGDKLVAEWRQ